MIFLRYICGFFLQIFPYAFFCLYPFWNSFRVKRRSALILALSVLTLLALPFSLIGETNFGGDYEELYCNIIFYIAVLFFLVLYLAVIRARISEKLFVFFVVMSYGFFVTRIISFVFSAFNLAQDKFMYPHLALLLTLGINIVAAKPIMLLMDRVRLMVESGLQARIWHVLCTIPVLFVALSSAIFFPELIPLENYLTAPLYSILITIFAFIIYVAIFSVMEYIRRQQEEFRNAERRLEGYRKAAENNDRIREIHHEVKHHLNALSAYMEQADYDAAREYLRKFSEDAENLPSVSYTVHPLINSILAEYSRRAKKSLVRTEFSIAVGEKLCIDDSDLCSLMTNMLENAVEGCEKAPPENRFIRFKLHANGNFLYFGCENSCDCGALNCVGGRYVSTKKDGHGYGIRIMRQIAEKYNGIITLHTRDGVFEVTTNLCLDDIR